MGIYVLTENRAFKPKVRTETLNGREYLVAPATLIVPGVLNGNQGPLYYPPEEVAANPLIWNGMPLVLEHPYSPQGDAISARDPAVLNKQGLGFVFSSKTENGKARAETWFDVQLTNAKDPQLLEEVRNGNPIEISTGLLTDNEPNPGEYQGIAYNAVAKNYRADHLAVIRNGKGACSVQDGCGVNNKSQEPTTNNSSRTNEGKIMALTKEKREQLVTKLVANCDCEETKKSISGMPDAQLELIGNAMHGAEEEAAKAALKAKEEEDKKKVTANAQNGNNQTTDLSGMSYEDLVAKVKQDVTANQQTPPSEDEWFKTAPPHIKKMVENSLRIEQQQKTELIEQLTANLGDAKEATAKLLEDKSIDDLQLMINVSGKAQPQRVTNYSVASAPMGIPTATVNQRGPTVNREAILPLPSLMDLGEPAEAEAS